MLKMCAWFYWDLCDRVLSDVLSPEKLVVTYSHSATPAHANTVHMHTCTRTHRHRTQTPHGICAWLSIKELIACREKLILALCMHFTFKYEWFITRSFSHRETNTSHDNAKHRYLACKPAWPVWPKPTLDEVVWGPIKYLCVPNGTIFPT